MRMHVPTDQELLSALASIKRGCPGIGVKKMLQELATSYPEWQLSRRRVRDLHAQADAGTSHVGNNGADAPAASSAGNSVRFGDDDLRDFFEAEIAKFESIARSGEPVPIRQYRSMANSTFSLGMLRAVGDSKFACGLEVFRSYVEGSEPEEDVSEDLYMLYAPYRLFRAEWRAYLGPKDAALPHATPYKDNEEAQRFVILFPRGIGHYTNQPNLSFDEYAMHRLRISNPGFRASKEWLLWVLTRTENKELSIAINCVLAVKHGIKGRHLGRGKLEVRTVEAPFSR